MRWVWIFLCVASCGPVETAAFRCARDTQCTSANGQGACTDEGYCAFLDADCESGLRYAEHSGEAVAGQCVAP
jgi:hypothetical protein